MNEPRGETRVRSLDVFRGATIAGMILVNNPGSWSDSYAQLRHSAWNGWTFTDMIFPFFLWIMGVAMTYSFARRRASGASQGEIIGHVIRRGLIIFGLGIVVNGFPFGVGAPFSLATLRIPGVLQRIAICYVVVSILLMNAGPRAQVYWVVGLLVLYWGAVALIPVPSYGSGIYQPVGSLCWFVDSSLLSGHTWIYAPAPGFDPEGIVSTIPAIATVIFGALTGQWLRSARSVFEKTCGMFVTGFAMLLMAVVMDVWLPINKNMWTSSYAVLMGGWALVCFATFYWIIDVKGFSRFSSAVEIFGKNAITLYVLSELLATLLWVVTVTDASGKSVPLQTWLYSYCTPLFNPANASLAFAVAFVLLMYAAGWVMWRRKWFLKV